MPPSGYSSTSTCAEKPLTWVKKPTLRVSTGIDTWKYFAWMIGGSARVTDFTGAGIGGSLRVVDDQMAHLLTLDEQIALEAIEEVLVQLLALAGLVFRGLRFMAGRRCVPGRLRRRRGSLGGGLRRRDLT